ncbi:iron-sulfur cluster biosynthesis family protein [Paenibacillus spiritus]|uniref:Iron-sulfur cluster biosynthesis family protein n=1 Tax=Paenibacillus spiritus TaxID=2496557 RepID=A0A5J5GEI6_9BACL|nr:iron-sulfur cluster biosynthesis family protein [Paenibacillus spiritus]
MKLKATPRAEEKLKALLKDRPGTFKLYYDTGAGCGCDGISVLRLLKEPEPGDISVEAGNLPLVITAEHELFYESELRLDADEHAPIFRLSSDSQIYSSNMRVRDERDLPPASPPPAAVCELHSSSNTSGGNLQ